MTSRLSNSPFHILGLFTTIFFVVALVNVPHAEASKISLLSSGADKALFFLALVVLLTLIGGIIALIRFTYKKATESHPTDAPRSPNPLSSYYWPALTTLYRNALAQ